MRIAQLKNQKTGEMDSFKCYTEKEFPYLNMPEDRLHCFRSKGVESYLKLFGTFDIESTTIDERKNGKAPYGFMYHWQMDLGGVIAYGRTWLEWVHLMNRIVDWLDINIENRLIIYVHNLSYEFQFMRCFIRDYFGGCTIFAISKRKPIKVVCNNGIEFRCSYILTNMSLEKAGENELGMEHLKAAGDLDYRKLRTPATELDDTEFGYCIGDIVSLYELVKNRLKNDSDTLESIPLTSTGYVRRDCRSASRKEKGYRDMFIKNHLIPSVYTLLFQAGRGGDTHSSRFRAGRIWHEVDSYDVRSSYPAQMLLQKFPMTKFMYYGKIENDEEFRKLLNEYACLFTAIFHDLKLKPEVAMPYIPRSKGLKGFISSCSQDNGRVISANIFGMSMTDIDYKIIEEQYTWESVTIIDMHFAEYGYLPESIRGVVLKYFGQKCQLKEDIKQEEAKGNDSERLANLNYLYAKCKNKLNGIFGMCYTNPVREEISINDSGEWIITSPDLEEALNKYNESRNSFLVYAWGVWVTAWARLWLQNLYKATGDESKGNFVIYGDTDSSKAYVTDDSEVERLNREIEALCEERKAYADVNGTRYYIGIYEKETKKEKYKEFITLGAKKYAYTDSKGLHVTISGVNKKLGAAEMKDIKNFKPGFIFKEAGGVELYYNDDQDIHTININGVDILTASNIGMVDSTYTLGISNEYAELIGFNMLEDME